MGGRHLDRLPSTALTTAACAWLPTRRRRPDSRLAAAACPSRGRLAPSGAQRRPAAPSRAQRRPAAPSGARFCREHQLRQESSHKPADTPPVTCPNPALHGLVLPRASPRTRFADEPCPRRSRGHRCPPPDHMCPSAVPELMLAASWATVPKRIAATLGGEARATRRRGPRHRWPRSRTRPASLVRRTSRSSEARVNADHSALGRRKTGPAPGSCPGPGFDLAAGSRSVTGARAARRRSTR